MTFGGYVSTDEFKMPSVTIVEFLGVLTLGFATIGWITAEGNLTYGNVDWGRNNKHGVG